MNVPSDPRELPATEKLVPLDKVQYTDRRTQGRLKIDHNRVADLAAILTAGKKFDDPIEVYFDGSVYWVGDGFHRALAYEKAHKDRVPALVREGGWQLARQHALGANAKHGLPRSRKDLRHAIALAFTDYPTLSDRAIAKICYTTHQTVAACRPSKQDTDVRTYVDKHGNVTTMNVAGLRGRAIPPLEPVNEFHQLPDATKTVLLDVLSHLGTLSKRDHAFVLSWLKGHLPASPQEAVELRTQLEVEALPADGDEEGQQEDRF
jgi:hypothetical protein